MDVNISVVHGFETVHKFFQLLCLQINQLFFVLSLINLNRFSLHYLLFQRRFFGKKLYFLVFQLLLFFLQFVHYFFQLIHSFFSLNLFSHPEFYRRLIQRLVSS